ncbi:MAG: polysaccharide deacetylase family protein [Sarcina sp.]
MKINKIITFSLIFSSIGALGSGCYYNSKLIDTTAPTPSNQIEEQQKVTPQKKEDDASQKKDSDIDNSQKKEANQESTTNKPNSNASQKNSIDKNYTSSQENAKSDKKNINLYSAESQPSSSNIKGENIIPSARKYATPVKEVSRMITNPSLAKKKTVFLTFDDGPDIAKTPKILNILRENNVHATFFVLGSRLQNQTSKNILIQTYKSGNAIANHSYSHNMKAIYPQNTLCITTFIDEVKQTNAILRDILGPNFNCAVLRMPGGYNSREYYNDPNLAELSSVLNNVGLVSIDWNAENGDAVNGTKNATTLLNNVKKYSQGQKVVVLLMHDISNTTVQALPSIIKYYKDNGYEFRVISN